MRRFDEIRTARLLMRRWRDADREPFAQLSADAEVMRYFPAPLDRAASDGFVDLIEERFETQGYGLWALEVGETRAFIGFAGLNPMPEGVPGEGHLEVGYRLAKAAWHRGYATEAGRAALDVAFGGVGVNEVWSLTAVLNEPSQAVMRRLGLRHVTTADHPRVAEGHPIRPHVFFRVTRAEFAETA